MKPRDPHKVGARCHTNGSYRGGWCRRWSFNPAALQGVSQLHWHLASYNGALRWVDFLLVLIWFHGCEIQGFSERFWALLFCTSCATLGIQWVAWKNSSLCATPFLQDPFSNLPRTALHTHTHLRRCGHWLDCCIIGIDLAEGLSDPEIECHLIKEGRKSKVSTWVCPGMFSKDHMRASTTWSDRLTHHEVGNKKWGKLEMC